MALVELSPEQETETDKVTSVFSVTWRTRKKTGRYFQIAQRVGAGEGSFLERA